MRDFRQYIGRRVSVSMPGNGSLVGKLVAVGRTTLSIEVDRMYFDDGQPAPTPTGVVLVPELSVGFVQVV